MSILKTKIIRNFINVVHLFGINAREKERQIIIDYLEKVYQKNLDVQTKQILLQNMLSADEINIFIRKYKYMLLNQENTEEMDEAKDIYEIARECINSFKKIGVTIEDSNISLLQSLEILSEEANKNVVLVNSIYGILYSTGVFVEKDLDKANRYYKKNALWNKEFDMLALAYNCKDDIRKSTYWYLMAEKMFDISFIKENIKTKELYESIQKKVEEDYIIHKLLADERASLQYNSQIYNPILSKILYEGKFSINEKRTLLFSQREKDFYPIGALVTKEKPYVIGEHKYDFRLEEQEKIIKALKDMSNKINAAPLIINCESKLIMNIYSSFINNYFKGNVVKDIDAARFNFNNLVCTNALNNYLYQLVTQNSTNNIVIKYHNLHKVKEGYLSLILNLLNEEKYYIHDIMVSVDKSKLINIIFVQDLHSLDNRILQASNIITLKKESVQEKEEIVRTKIMIELEKKDESLVSRYLKDKNFNEKIEKYIKNITSYTPYDKIVSVVNEVVSRVCYEDEEVILDIITKSKESHTIGF